MYRRQLEKSDVDNLLAELGHTASDRAEKMDVATLIRLSNHVYATIQQRGGDALSEDSKDHEDVEENQLS